MPGLTIDLLAAGQSASFTKTISESDVYIFAGVTGDFNAAHVNEEYAKQTRFGRRVAHGMLTAGFISAVLGAQLPGPGTIYMGQDLEFLAPAYIGDTVTAMVTVESIDREKNRITLDTVCTNQEGKVLLRGKAVVRPPLR
uniref:Putative MaoC domain containing acyl-dehydratase n=1 Tax=termite gut metagenome TaxID=433724 RepID=S0DDS3_9ZZZZ